MALTSEQKQFMQEQLDTISEAIAKVNSALTQMEGDDESEDNPYHEFIEPANNYVGWLYAVCLDYADANSLVFNIS